MTLCRPGLRRRSRSRSRGRAWIALAALTASVITAGACIKRGYPLAPNGQVDIRTDVAGQLFAAGEFDEKGRPTGPRQQPYSSGVKIFMTEGGEAAFGGIVEVRVEPSEALVLSSDPSEPSDDTTCAFTEGSFQCIATVEGYASFVVASQSDWSGDAKIVVTWADQREERDITVLPAGLPEEATNFTLIAGGLDDTDRVLATFLALECSINAVPDNLGSKWRDGEIRVREAFVRATAPPSSPGVVENAPVIIESLHSEAALSLAEDCKERQTRLRVLLGATGESAPFYVCFSDIGGTVALAVTSGQKAIEPNRTIEVDPEPRLLRVRTLKETVVQGEPVDLFEISAYNAERERIAVPVDLLSSNQQVLPLSKASVTLSDEEDEATILTIVPASTGAAELQVTPRLLSEPKCISQTVTVVEPPP